MNANGIMISEEEKKRIARDAWVYNWSTEQIDRAVANSASVSLSGGDYAAQAEDLHAYADDYGISLSDSMAKQFQADFLAKKGSEGVKALIRAQAAAMHPVFAQRIESGQSLRSLTDAYFQKASEMLEIDPNEIGWNDPLFANGRAFSFNDANSGQPVQKTLYDFEKDIRKDKRWLNTKNARDELTQGAYQLLQRFGLAG